jgi:hypothetical protein
VKRRSRQLEIPSLEARQDIHSQKASNPDNGYTFYMSKPEWFRETQGFCRNAGINIVAWGPNTLVVEVKSPDRAKEIARQLGHLGFKVVEDQNDECAGMLSLSRNAG